MYRIVITTGLENWKCIFFYLKYGAPFTMHVVFVFPNAYALANLESGNISLNRELNVSAAANGILLLTITMAIFTSAEVTFESINMDYFSQLTYTRYCVKCIVALK